MESRPVIYIRTDGNASIATGHLMRCLSIARALVRRHALPVFLVSDEDSVSLLRGMMTQKERSQRGLPLIHMQTDYRDPKRELPALIRILTDHPGACFLADSYFIPPDYLEEVRKVCRVAFLDDLQAFDPPVDLVINYDLAVPTECYTKAGRILTGGAYTPLREQFAAHSCHIWDHIRDIFLSTGGTDPYRVKEQLLGHLLASSRWQDCCFHVLAGPFDAGKDPLNALAARDSRVILHENVTEMAELMAECDLAFCAGGTTLYELCAIGVPSVSFSMADNQLPGVRAFEKAGLIPWAGDVRGHEDFWENAVRMLELLAGDLPRRRDVSMRMRMAIDGRGADRIAEALTSL